MYPSDDVSKLAPPDRDAPIRGRLIAGVVARATPLFYYATVRPVTLLSRYATVPLRHCPATPLSHWESLGLLCDRNTEQGQETGVKRVERGDQQ